MPSDPGLVIGIDVGGTFTDCVAFDPCSGRLDVAKVPTTPWDQAEGLLTGIGALGVGERHVDLLVHGFTTGTNAVIERRGAELGLIATRGFRDVLELRRRDRPRTWGLRDGFTPLIPRYRRLEIAERMLHDGTPLVPPQRAEVEAVARRLLDAGAEAVVVSLLHAYANREHERQVAEWVRSVWPNPYVTAGTEVMPEWREFERTATATVNGFIQPVVSGYLKTLKGRLREGGIDAKLLVVRSNGGLMDADDAARLPVFTILSGPAAGVAAAAALARSCGADRVITYDMGGTSLDVSLVMDGRVQLSNERFIDFGLPVHVPQADIDTIGAGGGSIAWLDDAGVLRVGPQSAGAHPGPACYGRRGEEPTVTDAHVALGTIDPALPIGGDVGVTIDRELALAALGRLGRRLGLDPLRTAEAVVEVANTKMVGALRGISVQRGHDPRDFVLMPFGGAAALHVCALIELLGAGGALIPASPGVMSAVGCVFADLQHELTATLNRPLADLPAAGLNGTVSRHVVEGAKFLGVDPADLMVKPVLTMSYAGQTHTITVPVDASSTTAEIEERFADVYRRRFGRALERTPINVEGIRTSLSVRRTFDVTPVLESAPRPPLAAERRVRHRGRDIVAAVRWRAEIDSPLDGPLVVVQPDATIWVEPGFRCRPLNGGTLKIERCA